MIAPQGALQQLRAYRSVGLIARLRRFRGLFALNSLVDLFAVHSYLFRGVNPDTYLIPFDPEDGDRDIASDHDRLTSASRQN